MKTADCRSSQEERGITIPWRMEAVDICRVHHGSKRPSRFTRALAKCPSLAKGPDFGLLSKDLVCANKNLLTLSWDFCSSALKGVTHSNGHGTGVAP